MPSRKKRKGVAGEDADGDGTADGGGGSAGPRRMLVILDVNGLLMDNAWRLDASKHARRHPDAIAGNFLVYERPHLHEFLRALLDLDHRRHGRKKRTRKAEAEGAGGDGPRRLRNCDVAVWSSGRKNNVRNFLRCAAGRRASGAAGGGSGSRGRAARAQSAV